MQNVSVYIKSKTNIKTNWKRSAIFVETPRILWTTIVNNLKDIKNLQNMFLTTSASSNQKRCFRKCRYFKKISYIVSRSPEKFGAFFFPCKIYSLLSKYPFSWTNASYDPLMKEIISIQTKDGWYCSNPFRIFGHTELQNTSYVTSILALFFLLLTPGLSLSTDCSSYNSSSDSLSESSSSLGKNDRLSSSDDHPGTSS